MICNSGTSQIRAMLSSLALCAATLLSARTVSANDIFVNTFGPPTGRLCSLTQAIQAANTDRHVGSFFGGCAAGSSGPDVIHLQTGTYQNYGGPIQIANTSGPVTIQGTGMGSTTIVGLANGGPTIGGIVLSDCINFSSATYVVGALTFANLTLRQASGDTLSGICVVNSVLSLNGVRVTGFQSGGIVAQPNSQNGLTINVQSQSQIDNNHSFEHGAGIAMFSQAPFPGGYLNVYDTSITSNFSEGSGGGIYWDGSAFTLLRSTVTSNTSFNGGGIALDPQQTTYANFGRVTVTGNHAFIVAGGIAIGSGVIPATFEDSSSVTGNVADQDAQQDNLNSDSWVQSPDVQCDTNSFLDLSGPEWSQFPSSDGTCRF